MNKILYEIIKLTEKGIGRVSFYADSEEGQSMVFKKARDGYKFMRLIHEMDPEFFFIYWTPGQTKKGHYRVTWFPEYSEDLLQLVFYRFGKRIKLK